MRSSVGQADVKTLNRRGRKEQPQRAQRKDAFTASTTELTARCVRDSRQDAGATRDVGAARGRCRLSWNLFPRASRDFPSLPKLNLAATISRAR